MMDCFKLSKDFRIAFKEKLKSRLHAVKQKPLITDIKQEPLSINIKQEITTQKEIKMEPTTQPVIPMGWCTAYSFEPEPKHDIIIPKKEINPLPSRNGKVYNSHQSNSKPFPQKRKYKARRRSQILTAKRVHDYLSSRDPNSLSQKQLDSLTWAESILLRGSLPRRKPQVDAAIEIQDEDTNSELNEAFIHDETVNLIPDTLQLTVVDSTNPGGRYSLAHARLIEKTLSKAVITYILENPSVKKPVFGKSVYFDGVLVLDCKDEASYDFARLILCDIKLWDGSRLKMVEPEKSPFNSIGTVLIPDVGIDKNVVLDVLKAQNPFVDMNKWKVLGETKFKTGYRQYSIMISNPPIYFQRHKQLRLYFGGSEVILKPFGCQWLWNCKV